jgi:hypothetical protein
MGAKEDESTTGRVWAAGFHHVTARSRLARILELMNRLFSLMFIPCIIRRIRRDQQYALIVPLLYSKYWLLHVSAVAYHHQGAC